MISDFSKRQFLLGRIQSGEFICDDGTDLFMKAVEEILPIKFFNKEQMEILWRKISMTHPEFDAAYTDRRSQIDVMATYYIERSFLIELNEKSFETKTNRENMKKIMEMEKNSFKDEY